jgi:hypothetical protein
MSRKVFTAGEVLAAADVNSFLMDQTVMSFAGTAARGSAIPSPVEGMTTYLEDSNSLAIYDGSNWKNSLKTTGGVLQVVSATKTDSFSTASGSFVDITGLSVSITPTSSTSKILVLVDVFVGTSADGATLINLNRDSTAIAQGVGGSQPSSMIGTPRDLIDLHASTLTFLDSPSSSSSITYKLQGRRVGAGTSYINRRGNDTVFSTASSITVMEIAA